MIELIIFTLAFRERIVASAAKGYGGSEGKATSASTASCWSINVVISLFH